MIDRKKRIRDLEAVEAAFIQKIGALRWHSTPATEQEADRLKSELSEVQEAIEHERTMLVKENRGNRKKRKRALQALLKHMQEYADQCDNTNESGFNGTDKEFAEGVLFKFFHYLTDKMLMKEG